MAGFGRIIRSDRESCVPLLLNFLSVLLINLLTSLCRPAMLLEGEQGARLQQKIWYEVVYALRKDVPEVINYTRP